MIIWVWATGKCKSSLCLQMADQCNPGVHLSPPPDLGLLVSTTTLSFLMTLLGVSLSLGLHTLATRIFQWTLHPVPPRPSASRYDISRYDLQPWCWTRSPSKPLSLYLTLGVVLCFQKQKKDLDRKCPTLWQTAKWFPKIIVPCHGSLNSVWLDCLFQIFYNISTNFLNLSHMTLMDFKVLKSYFRHLL